MSASDRDIRIVEECESSDEPCIVFRAKDKHAVNLLQRYLDWLLDDGAEEGMLNAVGRRIREFHDWQEANPDKVKAPDLRPGESTT